MADPTLYLFDGHNLLHAGGFADPRELATCSRAGSRPRVRGACSSSTVSGRTRRAAPLEVRFVDNADSLIERLASENRSRERVCVVSSDATVRATAGRLVQTRTSQTFLRDYAAGRARRAQAVGAGRPARRLHA